MISFLLHETVIFEDQTDRIISRKVHPDGFDGLSPELACQNGEGSERGSPGEKRALRDGHAFFAFLLEN